jgi:hypothetical protein
MAKHYWFLTIPFFDKLYFWPKWPFLKPPIEGVKHYFLGQTTKYPGFIHGLPWETRAVAASWSTLGSFRHCVARLQQ